jgi:hypothetical protein
MSDLLQANVSLLPKMKIPLTSARFYWNPDTKDVLVEEFDGKRTPRIDKFPSYIDGDMPDLSKFQMYAAFLVEMIIVVGSQKLDPYKTLRELEKIEDMTPLAAARDIFCCEREESIAKLKAMA